MENGTYLPTYTRHGTNEGEGEVMPNMIGNVKSGSDKWSSFQCFKVFKDAEGEWLQVPKYVSFKDGVLCGYYNSNTEAELGYLRGDEHLGLGIRLKGYQGIAKELK